VSALSLHIDLTDSMIIETSKMKEDVGIAEQQKVNEQGRDDHIKQLSIQISTGTFFNNFA